MRAPIGRPIRVGPGDHIIIRGQLSSSVKLGRLYVFAKEGGRLSSGRFSPYVQNIGAMVSSNRPNIYTPMSMRLDSHRPQHQISFVADIDGFICVVQEVDTA